MRFPYVIFGHLTKNHSSKFIQVRTFIESLYFQIYLSQFGYLPPSARNPANGGLLDRDTWSKAIMDFQGFAGVNITGKT